MSDSRLGDAASRPTRRRRAVLFLCIFIICTLAWHAFEYFVQIDRYRPMAVSKLEKATGLPVSIGELDLALRPLPVVFAHRVTLGGDDFGAVISRVTLRPRFRQPFRKRLHIADVILRDVVVTAPAGTKELTARLRALGAAGKKSAPSDLNVTIDEIHAQGGRLRVLDATGDAHELISSFSLSLGEVLSDIITVDARATSLLYGGPARMTVKGAVSREPEMRLTGVMGVTGANTLTVPGLSVFPQSVIDAEFTVESVPLSRIAGTLSGRAAIASRATKAFSGPFSAEAFFEDGDLAIDDLAWASPGMTLRGAVETDGAESVTVRLPELNVSSKGIAALADVVPSSDFGLAVVDDAAIELRDVLLARAHETPLQLIQGDGAFRGIDVVFADGAKPFSNVAGTLEAGEGTVTIDLAGEGLKLAGTVTPDLTAGTVALDLSGEALLNRERLVVVLASDAVTEMSGNVQLNHVKGTFGAGVGLPSDFSVDGAVTDGKLAFETAAFSDTWEPIEATFTAGINSVKTTLRAQSARQGPLEADGAYDVTAGTWEGRVVGDLTYVGDAFAGKSAWRRLFHATLSSYGLSRFRATARFPSEESPDITIDFEREASPSLSGEVRIARGKKSWTLQQAGIEGTPPLAVLKTVAPRLDFDGQTHVEFAVSETSDFHTTIDLSGGAIKTGRYIEKRAGDPLVVHLAGPTWQPETLKVSCFGESLEARFEEGRILVNDLDVDVAPLAALLVQGGEASGRVTGTLGTQPTTVNLVLQDVALGLSPEVGVDSVNGGVVYDGGHWSLQELALRGARSDCSMNAEWRENACTGAVRGEQLDVNALIEMFNEAKTFQIVDEEEAAHPPVPLAAGAAASRFDVELEAVLFRRARIEGVRASAVLSGEGVTIKEFTANSHGGLIAGDASLLRAPRDVPRDLALKLVLKDVDARLLDELFCAESREFAGRTDGQVNVRTQVGAGADPMARLNGTMRFEGRDGTFGELGLTTKLLTALRTTEIVRLRMPSYRGEGLRYTTCLCDLSASNGVLTVERFELRNPSLEVKAQGTFDFPQNETDVRIAVNTLESVTGLARSVPLVGKAAGAVGDVTAVQLRLTGPPREPNVTVLGAAAGAGVKAGQSLVGRTTGAIRGILGGSGTEKNGSN